MTGTPDTYATIVQRAANATAPWSPIWGPTIGFRPMPWVRAWVDASITYRAPANPALKG